MRKEPVREEGQQNGGDKLSHDINCTNYHVETISDFNTEQFI